MDDHTYNAYSSYDQKTQQDKSFSGPQRVLKIKAVYRPSQHSYTASIVSPICKDTKQLLADTPPQDGTNDILGVPLLPVIAIVIANMTSVLTNWIIRFRVRQIGIPKGDGTKLFDCKSLGRRLLPVLRNTFSAPSVKRGSQCPG